jgi:misacylated tRNA(Ala) deacylase
MNETIAGDLPVTEEFMPIAEAGAQFNLGRLPADAGDNIRIIRIGSYDACPCIGLHVRSTREIGVFRIVSASHADGLLRLRYRLDRPA